MRNISKRVITVIVLILVLVGCSASEEEILTETKEMFVEGFYSEPIEANEETDGITYYLPKELQLTEESENNLIFEKGKQLYLLFYNPVEGLESRVNLERDLEFEKEALLFETIEDEGRIGYLVVVPEEEDLLKLIIGIGGQKITTFSSLSNLADNTKTMIEVLNSITYIES